MISNDLFIGMLFCVVVLFSPLLALFERLILGLGILLVVFCLGLILLSTPILFVSGVFLIIASEATVANGLYYVLFSVISPFMLIPLFLFFCNLIEDETLFNSSYAVPLVNTVLILLTFMIFGTSWIYFTAVIILSSVLIAGDFIITKITQAT